MSGFHRQRDARGRFVGSGGGSHGGGGFAPSGVSFDLHGLSGAHESLHSLTEQTKGFGEALSGAAEKAGHVAMRIGEIGLAGGIALATHGVIGLNNELEQTKIGLAAIFQSQGYYQSFESGMRRSAEEVQKMRKDVMLLPTTFQELAHTMQMIATPAAHAGASIDQVRTLAEKTTLAAGIFMMPQELAAREMAQLLTGHMNARNRLGLEMGFEAKQFNQKSHSEQLKEIEERLAKFDDSAAAFGDSFKAQATSFKDNVLMFEQLATHTLFERVVHSLHDVNTWFTDHKHQVEEIANLVDRRLVAGWDKIEQISKRVATIAGPVLDRLVHMQPAEMGHHLLQGAEGLALARMAGGGVGAFGSGIGMLGNFAKMAPMFGEGGALAGAAGPAMMAIGPMAAAAAVSLVALGGAIHGLNDPTASYHKELVKLTGDLETHAVDALKRLGSIAEELHLERVVDAMGVGLVTAVDQLVDQFRMLESVIQGVAKAANYLSDYWNPLALHGNKLNPTESNNDVSDHTGDVGMMAGVLRLGLSVGHQEAENNRMNGTPANAVMKVEIVVKGSDDPSRVARFTVQELEKMTRNPRRSPTVPNYAATRMR